MKKTVACFTSMIRNVINRELLLFIFIYTAFIQSSWRAKRHCLSHIVDAYSINLHYVWWFLTEIDMRGKINNEITIHDYECIILEINPILVDPVFYCCLHHLIAYLIATTNVLINMNYYYFKTVESISIIQSSLPKVAIYYERA